VELNENVCSSANRRYGISSREPHNPMTAMTGLAALSPLDAIAVPSHIESTTLEVVMAKIRQHVERLMESLDGMHKKVVDASGKARAKGRARSMKHRMAQFDIGDFVLYANAKEKSKHKPKVRWEGPAQVVDTVSNWIFKIKNLVTGDVSEMHANRLKLYADADLRVDET
jgi:hypothetical protein